MIKKGLHNGDIFILFGDSQIALWRMVTYFGERPIVNRGVSGDNARMAKERFSKDVISLKSKKTKAVMILIGTNDVAEGRNDDEILSDAKAMVEAANRENIHVFIGSLIPVSGRYLPLRPLVRLRELNEKMRRLAENNRSTYLDFWTPMIDERGMFRRELTFDGLHPNVKAYQIMTELVLEQWELLCHGKEDGE